MAMTHNLPSGYTERYYIKGSTNAGNIKLFENMNRGEDFSIEYEADGAVLNEYDTAVQGIAGYDIQINNYSDEFGKTYQIDMSYGGRYLSANYHRVGITIQATINDIVTTLYSLTDYYKFRWYGNNIQNINMYPLRDNYYYTLKATNTSMKITSPEGQVILDKTIQQSYDDYLKRLGQADTYTTFNVTYVPYGMNLDICVGDPNSNYYKLRYIKIHNNNTDFALYPCTRDADNVPGLYDVVNDVFYTSEHPEYLEIGRVIKPIHRYKIMEGNTSRLVYDKAPTSYGYSLQFGIPSTTNRLDIVNNRVGDKLLRYCKFGEYLDLTTNNYTNRQISDVYDSSLNIFTRNIGILTLNNQTEYAKLSVGYYSETVLGQTTQYRDYTGDYEHENWNGIHFYYTPTSTMWDSSELQVTISGNTLDSHYNGLSNYFDTTYESDDGDWEYANAFNFFTDHLSIGVPFSTLGLDETATDEQLLQAFINWLDSLEYPVQFYYKLNTPVSQEAFLTQRYSVMKEDI